MDDRVRFYNNERSQWGKMLAGSSINATRQSEAEQKTDAALLSSAQTGA
jgi:hypothetical protein